MFLNKTHFAWGRALAVYTTLSLAILTSCSDDDSTVDTDTDPPTITITGLQANATVWNTVALTVTAEDNTAVKQVELRVDNKNLLTKTEKTFAYALNTVEEELADGQHTLTVIVTDDAGNEKKHDIVFTVMNTLISGNVPSDLLQGKQRGFIFLSDATGKAIVSYEFENNEPFRLKERTYEGADFYLTEVVVDISDNSEFLITYQKVKRGAWALTPLHSRDDAEAVAGQANVSFTLGLPNTDYTVRAGDNDNYGIVNGSNNGAQLSMNLHKNTSKLYITRRENDEHDTHYLLASASVGNNEAIDLSKVNTTLTEATKDLKAYNLDYAYARIYGIETAGDFSTRYPVYVGQLDNDAIMYRYPGNAFSSYISRVSLSGKDEAFDAYNQTDGLPDFEPLATTVDVAFKNNKFTGSATGNDIDFITFFIEGDANTNWMIFAPKGAVDIIRPELPPDLLPIITMEHPNPGIIYSAWQKFNFDGYDAFLDFVRNSAVGMQSVDRDGATYKQIEIPLTPSPLGRQKQRQN